MALVTTTDMFKKAYKGGYAIGAFNINNMEFIQAITEACNELRSPVILQCSKGAIKYAQPKYLVHMVKAAVESTDIPIALHLDHGDSFETCKDCVDWGFTSVMIDGSSKPYEENVAVSRQVSDYAHEHGVVVEAELGTLAGVEDDVDVADEKAQYTDPDQVVDFVNRTGVDSLAIAIGTSHGAFKFKPGQDPHLRLDILEEIINKLPGFPIVLHGSSAVPPKYVQLINDNGGALKDAIGIPDEQLRSAARSAVCKINIDSDLRLGMTAGIREHFSSYPGHFDPRQYLGDGRNYVREIVRDKIRNILGSEGKA